MARAYGNWAHYCIGADGLDALGVELIHLPRGRARKSNAADIHFVADASEVCWTRPHIETFVLMTGDVDFVALVRLLQGYGKRVVGYGIRGSTASRLVGECDEYIHVDKPREEKGNKRAPARRRGAREAKGARKTNGTAKPEGVRGEGQGASEA